MKIPLPNRYLKNLKSQPLPEITPDDVDIVIERAEEDARKRRKDGILANLDQQTLNNVVNQGFKTPNVLPCRKPEVTCTSPRLPRLVNLSFSQPSTPKTPAIYRHYQTGYAATPCLPQNITDKYSFPELTCYSFPGDGFVIPTPMVLSALDSLHAVGPFGENVPDILDFIDDDSHDMRAIDEHIRQHGRVDLNDNNVVDYLLGITEDTIKPEAKAIERPRQPQVWTHVDDDQPLRRMTRRRYLHSKVITAEEEKSLRKLKKKRDKERRKERKDLFKKETKGTRRSNRKRKAVKYS
ncbi:uncharacterized protein LOC124134822 isoform X1 [Haliotis rufescens]|uniref:uncharacterized protein LOC124134822 isoform X1 n=1 Tax=Haliotis rufescens TaxID=6454 RepID=UPI00201F5A1F|nr:uncharacterized protein LOC124134822 isoform X1 [Haliotis rufescens]